MTPAVSVEITNLDGVSRIQDAWGELAATCLEPSIFNEPGFLLAAARHLAPSPGPKFVTVWAPRGSGKQLVGLCPITPPRVAGITTAAVWTHPQATSAFPLLDREHGAAALQAMLSAVGRLHRSPGLLMTGLAADGPTAATLAALSHPVRRLEERSRAVLRSVGAAPGLPAKGRKELRRQWNRLGEHGPLTFSSAETVAEVGEALASFLALERRGWKGRRSTALASHAGTSGFANEAVQTLARTGQCRIDLLEVSARPAAVGIVLRAGDRAFYWKTAYDEALARFSPGLQLALHLSHRQLAQIGLAYTDSCAVPGHSMIDRIWHERMTVIDALVATEMGRSQLFNLACSIEAQRRRLRTATKAFLRKAVGARFG